MLALIFDALGSYFIVNKISRWVYLIPLAVLLGIVSSFSTNIAMHYIQPAIFSKHEAVLRAFIGSVWHPLFCMVCMWWFRRKKTKVQASNETNP